MKRVVQQLKISLTSPLVGSEVTGSNPVYDMYVVILSVLHELVSSSKCFFAFLLRSSFRFFSVLIRLAR